jgi:hypothetical protein
LAGREGDITEVFEKVNNLTHTGVVVRASHNRSLKDDSHHLWEKLAAQPIVDDYEVDLIKTNKRQARQAKLAVRFCPIQLRSPARLGAEQELPVNAVYANEVDCPEGEEPVSWMLLTSEVVTTIEDGLNCLTWLRAGSWLSKLNGKSQFED